MTCREKLAMEHPECVDPYANGGCEGCPQDYDYLGKPDYCHGFNAHHNEHDECTHCWDREIPDESKESFDILAFWQEVHTMIDDAMRKRDRSVSVYFNPETGMSVNTYPWPDADTLWEMYQNGQITANDFRAKMGLSMVKNPEQFMKRSFLDKELQMPKE